MKVDHHCCHGARELPPRDLGAQVWVPDQTVYGRMLEQPDSISCCYIVETSTKTIKRNRWQPNPIPEAATRELTQEKPFIPTQQSSPSENHPEESFSSASSSGSSTVERPTVVWHSKLNHLID